MPKSYDVAMTTEHKEILFGAKDSEMGSWRKNEVYFADEDINKAYISKDKIYNSKIVLDVKYKPDGCFDKAKFRLTFRGDQMLR